MIVINQAHYTRLPVPKFGNNLLNFITGFLFYFLIYKSDLQM